MIIGNYRITIESDSNYLIEKKDISITISIPDYDIARVIGISTLQKLKEETEKWGQMKNSLDSLDKSSKMFVKFMYYTGRWIINQSQTEEIFLNNKTLWYCEKTCLLSIILGMIMTKRKTIEMLCNCN